MDTAFDFQFVSIDEAKQVLDNGTVRVKPVLAKPKDWQRGPARIQEHRLLPETAKWLAELPARVAPVECARHYPRIVNRIHKLWPSPLFLKDYLVELLLDKRGGRQGFPHGITPELETFRQYYESLHPTRDSCVWSASDPHAR